MDIRLYATKKSSNLTDDELIKLLYEEVIELSEAIINNSNVEEECFDVMQMCINIFECKKPKSCCFKENIKHRLKLINRGHEFIKEGIK